MLKSNLQIRMELFFVHYFFKCVFVNNTDNMYSDIHHMYCVYLHTALVLCVCLQHMYCVYLCTTGIVCVNDVCLCLYVTKKHVLRIVHCTYYCN